MINISIQLTSITAERLAENIPPKLNFNINLALPSSKPYFQDKKFIIPFTFTATTLPPLVNITLKGRAIIAGESRELEKMEKDIKNKKIPQPLVQTVFMNMIAESIILSRSLGTPPPIPGIPAQPPQQLKKEKGPGTII
jgi:hypothetical protein